MRVSDDQSAVVSVYVSAGPDAVINKCPESMNCPHVPINSGTDDTPYHRYDGTFPTFGPRRTCHSRRAPASLLNPTPPNGLELLGKGYPLAEDTDRLLQSLGCFSSCIPCVHLEPKYHEYVPATKEPYLLRFSSTTPLAAET